MERAQSKHMSWDFLYFKEIAEDLWNSLKNSWIWIWAVAHLRSSCRLSPALKIRFSVYLRTTLEFVKDMHSGCVRLSLRTVYSPADYGVLTKMINKVCFEKQSFRREVGFSPKTRNWVSNELSTLPIFPSPFLTHISDYLLRHSPSSFHQDQPTQGRTMKGCCPQIPSASSPLSPILHLLLVVLLWWSPNGSLSLSFLCVHRLIINICPGILSWISMNSHNYLRVRSRPKTYPWRTMIGNEVLSSEWI